MAVIYRQGDIDEGLARSQRYAVIGYGSQGRSHALNLRDSGLDVVVGLYEGSRSWDQADADGMTVKLTPEAVEGADVIMVCTPDGPMAGIYAETIAPSLKQGQCLLFCHGFNILYGLIKPPADVDVALVSPKGAGPGVRRLYEECRGVPALVAVEQDATGTAHARALGYAWGLGSARTAIFETTFKEETETDLFGEQAVLCGGVPELCKAAFETLVEAGYQPEAAYFECIHEIKLIADLLYERGIEGMREKISDTAEWGGYETGTRVVDDRVRETLRDVLSHIQSGRFARDWTEESNSGSHRLLRRRKAERSHPAIDAGKVIRRELGIDSGEN